MSLALLAQFGAYSIPQLVVVLIVVAAVIGIGLVVLRQSGIVVPGFVMTIIWIVAVAVIAIVAIKFLMGFV